MSSSSIYSGGDDFTSNLNTIFEWLQKHTRLLVALLGVVLVIIAVMAFMASRNEERSDAGRSALFLAEKSLDTQLEAIAKASAPATPPATEAKNAKEKKAPTPPVTADTVAFTKMDVDTQLADGVTKLKGVAQDFSNTSSGFAAMMILGKTYLNHGNAAEASQWFTKAADNASKPLDRATAWESLGYSYENQAKYKEAIDAFDKGMNVGDGSVKADLLMSKARVYVAMHDATQAKATYDLVQSEFPSSEYSKLADLYKASVK